MTTPWEDAKAAQRETPPWEDARAALQANAPPAKEPGLIDKLKTLPAALRDTVLGQIRSGDPSVLQLPGVVPVVMDALKTHPTLAKIVGGMGGTVAGTPGGPAGMIAGGAAGAAGMDALSQLSQHESDVRTGGQTAPQTSLDALKRSGGAAAEGVLTGATGAGTLAGAPTVLKVAASPLGSSLIAGGTTLYKTGNPLWAAAAFGSTLAGVKSTPQIAKVAGKWGEAIKALNGKLATTLEADAPQAVNTVGKLLMRPEAFAKQATTGITSAEPAIIPNVSMSSGSAPVPNPNLGRNMAELSGMTAEGRAAAQAAPGATAAAEAAPTAIAQAPSVPAGVHGPTGLPLDKNGMIPVRLGGDLVRIDPNNPGDYADWLKGLASAKTPASPGMALAEDIQTKVAQWKRLGMSRGQIIQSLKDVHGLDKSTAETALNHIEEAGIPHAEILPEGQRSMPTVGGGKARPGPPPPYQGPSHGLDPKLMDLLQQSLQAYRMP